MADSHQARADTASAASFQATVERYQEDLKQVEEAIGRHFQSDVALIPAVSAYLIASGGKRVRPLLVAVTAKLCGYTGARHIDYGVVVEYIHAATLLHDDVVDEADLRRGAQTANLKYGNQASVLVGDFLFAKSFQIMSQGADMRVVQAVARATMNLAEGEVLQLVNTCNIDNDEETYLDTIFRKTGALIMACCEIGAILGGVSGEKERALAEYGRHIGIAFQLMDDVLDFTAEQGQWGKPLGADLAEGKITLPLIRAWSLCGGAEKEIIRNAIEAGNGQKEFLGPVMDILRKYDALAYTTELALSHAEEAKLKLAGFEASEHADALCAIADYVVSRGV